MARNAFTSGNYHKPRRNKFDMSHENKLSIKFGFLYPMFIQEVIPADSWRVNTEIFLRFAPMLAPIMHRINVYTHYFFVPHRLVWDEWEDFITGGSDEKSAQSGGQIPDVEKTPIFPQVELTATTAPMLARNQLGDYLGVPELKNPNTSAGLRISQLPFRAYQTIYNDYYRDQNLIDAVKVPKTSGIEGGAAFAEVAALRERAWEKDYFTTCMPWASKFGEASVHMSPAPAGAGIADMLYSSTTGQPLPNQTTLKSNSTGHITSDPTGSSGVRIFNENQGILINDLRAANALQKWLEKAARNGTRYVEQLKAHFGVTSPDSRLQRPEYLGGGQQVVSVSEVLNTTATQKTTLPDDSPGASIQGEMAGHGISTGSGHGFKRDFTEHGYIMGIISVIPKASYMDGLEKHWRRFDRYDHYFPDFAHLGEEPVTTSEVYFDWSDPNDLTTAFGYNQRYASYKYAYSNVHGTFKKELAFWHLSREFETKPYLNQTFITCRPRTDIFAAGGETDYIWCQLYHKAEAVRPIPYFSVPDL